MATSLDQLTLFYSTVCDTNVHSESKARTRAMPYNAQSSGANHPLPLFVITDVVLSDFL